MNDKIKILVQALVDETNEIRGIKDAMTTNKEWWLVIDWKTPEYKELFDSLGDETRKMITDAGLCPNCGEDEECPDGEEKNDEGECVPMKKEEEGDVLESNPGFTHPEPAAEEECPEGMTWNAEKKQCVEIENFVSKVDEVKELDAYEVLKRADELL